MFDSEFTFSKLILNYCMYCFIKSVENETQKEILCQTSGECGRNIQQIKTHLRSIFSPIGETARKIRIQWR